MKGNTDLILHILEDQKLGILIITETWLSHKDTIWLECNVLNTGNGLNIYQGFIQSEKHGGGICLISREYLDVLSKMS